jgi:ATP-binding protein involved in chromosome partitioning
MSIGEIPEEPVAPSPLLDALNDVVEPELGRGLGELGLVRAADQGRRGKAEVTVAVPTDPYFQTEALTALLRDAALAVDGVNHVDITLDVLSEDEQAELRRRLIGDPEATAGAQPAHGHAEGRAIPFADAGSKTRVLLVASGKGGVGKSSVTVNLAVALADRGKKVAVVDADVWGYSIPRMLGVERPPLAVERMIVPPEQWGVRCISMGFFAREDQAVIWRGPMLHKALEQFLTDVWWNEPDYLLVDLPPGTGDISISLAQFLPRGEVLVVTTPQPAAQRVAQRAGVMAEKVNLQVAGVIENMSWFTGDDGARYEIFGAGGGAQLAELLDVPLIGQVPLTIPLREGGDSGQPIVAVAPDSEPGKAFASIADWIEEHGPKRIYRSELKII